MTPVAERTEVRARSPWIPFAVIAAALLLVYAPTIRSLVSQWGHDDDMGHGFFVPVVAGYVVWQKRDKLRNLAMEPCWWGLPVMIFAAAQALAGSLGAELFLSRTAMLESLAGLILVTGGKRAFGALAFPLLLLFFMIPIPGIVYGRITFPLQMIASRAAEVALGVLQIPVLRNGNVLELPEKTLSVVEACSGIRSLLSLAFLSLVYGYFMARGRWMRMALFLAAVPVAIAANAVRVTMTGVLTQYNAELASGFLHSAEGWIIFMLGLGMLFALHMIFARVFSAVRTRR